MSEGENRRKGAVCRQSAAGKKALSPYAQIAVWMFVLLFSMGNRTISLASQGTVPVETAGNEEPELTDEDLLDISDYEGDMTDEELDRALEEYINQMDMDSLIQGTGMAGKVTDPPLNMEFVQGKFKFTLPNGNSFLSSVPRGTVTSNAVDMELPEGTVGLVNYNDEGENFANSWHFTKPGNYDARLLMYQQPGSMAVDYNLYEIHFYFTIIEKQDNTLGVFPAPEGFVIKEVKRDGKQQKVDGQRGYFLGADGYYEIRCERKGQEGVFVDTGFLRDTRAPFLSFSEEPKAEGIPGPVEFYPSEQNCRIYMNYNGNHGYAVSNLLTAAGNYELSVEDEAGNQRVYHIKLRQTYNPIDKRVILASIAILAIAGIRLVALRQDMRII